MIRFLQIFFWLNFCITLLGCFSESSDYEPLTFSDRFILTPQPSNKINLSINHSKQVSLGTHALAIVDGGRVLAWGLNRPRYTPADVPIDIDNAVAVVARGNNSLVLLSDGRLLSWGYFGSNLPRKLRDTVGIVDIHENIALKADGTVVTWEIQDRPEVFQQSLHALESPSGLHNVIAVTSSSHFFAALQADGTVKTWSRDRTVGEYLNVPEGLTDVISISAAAKHVLALKSDGSVVAWGDTQFVPEGLTDIVSISAGQSHNMALSSDGAVYSWGPSLQEPGSWDNVKKEFNSEVVAIAANETFGSLILRESGSVYAYSSEPETYKVPSILTNIIKEENGYILNDSGSLSWLFTKRRGTEKLFQRNDIVDFARNDLLGLFNRSENLVYVATKAGEVIPYGFLGDEEEEAPLEGLNDVVRVFFGDDFLLSLRQEGDLVVSYLVEDESLPALPSGLDNIVHLASNNLNSTGVRENGTLAFWGDFSKDLQLSDFDVVTDAAKVSATPFLLFVLNKDGSVASLGSSFEDFPGFENVKDFAYCNSHLLMLKNDGSLETWGETRSTIPSPLGGITGIVRISGDDRASCLAVKTSGETIFFGEWEIPLELYDYWDSEGHLE